MSSVPLSSRRFHGLYASTICPMLEDGSIDERGLRQHLADVVGCEGMHGLLINGHAGENAALSRDELKLVLTVAREAAAHKLIVAGVNSENSDVAAELARDAEAAGADAIMVFAPFSWALGADLPRIVRHHEIIAEATKLPLFLFQGSVNAGETAYDADVLRALLKLPQVVGIKEGSWETSAYEGIRRLALSLRPDVAVMASGDEHLFSCFVLGTEGSLVSLAAVAPELIVDLDRAVRAGDLAAARAAHERIYPLAKAIYGTAPGSLATARLKACLVMLGRIASARCKPPVVALDAVDEARLRKALLQSGILAASHDALPMAG